MEAAYVAGLDVHSGTTVFVVEDATGAVLGRGSFRTSREDLERFVRRFRLRGGPLVGLESGNSAHFVAEVLMELGVEVRVIDAHEVRHKASRPTQKSDSRDAFEICDGLRRGIYRSFVHMPPRWAHAMREVLSRRRHFVKLASSQAAAIKRWLRSAGRNELARSSLKLEVGWKRLLSRVEGDAGLPDFAPDVVRSHHATWSAAREQVAAMEALLERQIAQLEPQQQEALERLDRIPGFGRIVSATVLAILFDARRFATAKQVGSYAGLTPMTFQSGERDLHGHITRRGSAELRSMLCEAAHCCRRPSHPLQPAFAKLVARRGVKIAVVAIAHRLLRVAWRILRDGVEFDPSKLGVEQGPFEEKVVRQWRRARPATKGVAIATTR